MSNVHPHVAPRMLGSKRHALRRLLHRMEQHAGHHLALPADEIRLDVQDTGKAYLVQADLPGISRRDLQVHIDGHRLSIVAAPSPDPASGDGGERVLLRELRHGRRSRLIELPDAVDDQGAQASLAAGVLSIMLPKRAAAFARSIAVA